MGWYPLEGNSLGQTVEIFDGVPALCYFCVDRWFDKVFDILIKLCTRS